MRNNLNKATPNNFELIFPKIPVSENISDMQGLTLNIHATVVPSLTLETIELDWQGGHVEQDSGTITFEPWLVNFTVDSSFSNWTMLYRWITFINNNKDRYGRERNDYKIDATLRVLDNFKEEIFAVDLVGLWINMLGEINLNYREGSHNLESSANFIYDRYEVRNII